MTPNPQHGASAGEAANAIRGLARETGSDVQELMTLHALEGLLSRIALSEYRDDFVLKGGVLLAAFAARRPTKDIDLQASRIHAEPDEVAERFRKIAALDVADGLVFETASLNAMTIRDDDDYVGVRVKLTAMLGTARLAVGIDVSFGDPIWPAPRFVNLPRMVSLGLPPLTLRGYPLTMVLAEKVVTALDRGIANTRWRDFADVFVLTRLHPLDPSEFRASLEAVATYRGITLSPMLPSLAPMGEHAQLKYVAWRSRSQREHELPEAFSELLTSVAGFADPVLSDPGVGGGWNPLLKTWG